MNIAEITFVVLGIGILSPCTSHPLNATNVIKEISSAPDWTTFLNRHVLDPERFPDYNSWGDAEWTRWMWDRFGEIPAGRMVHTVLIATPVYVQYSFSFHNLPCRHQGWDRFWSSAAFRTIILLKDAFEPSYRMWNCYNMFILAGLNHLAQPVHLESQSFDLPGNDLRFNQSTRNTQCQLFDYCDL